MVESQLMETGIAIVGVAGRFPGANDVESFWDNVRNGVESLRPLSDDELLAAGVPAAVLRDPNYVKAGGVLDGVSMFDAGFFGVSPKDAAIMDPQHRHFLECTVTALEHAGHAPSLFEGSIGVFAGCGMSAYFVNNILTNQDLLREVGFFLLRHTGNDRDFLPTTVSYKLDLRGPSMAIQTACSTSLVAIHTACQSLLSGECDMALAGGSTILVPHGQGYFYRENEPVSPDGHCRPFSSESQGTVVSSGVGVVVLRRLADALESGDTVYAVIRGSAVNNDGAGKVGYLAPSVDGHAGVVAEALSVAGVSADTIDYIEAHGTATPVGDPVEIAALTQAFRQSTDRVQFCRIGSVKGNIGHLDTAAGVASLIKVVKALEAREMPPSLHFNAPNPDIPFESSPFLVNAELRAWPEDDSPRRAGVSSLGIGGTNAHIVLEEAPRPVASDPPARKPQILPLSAKSKAALDARCAALATWFREHPSAEIADVAFTQQWGREAYDHRRVVVAGSPEEAANVLEEPQSLSSFAGKRAGRAARVVFMFPGAGAQYPNMCRGLYDREPVFRDAMNACLEIIRSLASLDLRPTLYPCAGNEAVAREQLEQPSRLLLAVFATEWALVKLWESWGVKPESMIGHSLGEYVAACVAGVMSLEDALRMVFLRGELIDTLSGGAMLSLACSEEEARATIGDELDLSVVNSPGLCVVSGHQSAIADLQERLAAEGVEGRLIPVKAAGHSRHLEPILERFRKGIADIEFSAPSTPYVSNVTGTWVLEEDATSPDYWVRHLRETVRFSDGMSTLLEKPECILLEVGPGQTLSAFARQQANKPRAVVPSVRKPDEALDDVHAALLAFGRLWVSGHDVDWQMLGDGERRLRIPLPTYPFEHKPYWVEPGEQLAAGMPPDEFLERQVEVDTWLQRTGWRPASIAGSASLAEEQVWLIFVDDAGVGARLAERLRGLRQTVVTVECGDTFYRFGRERYALAPEAGRSHYDTLMQSLFGDDLLPDRIVHLWGVTAREQYRPGSSFLHRNQECGFYSLLHLMQSLGDIGEQLPRDLTVVANGVQAVTEGDALPYPEKATVLGPVRVIPREFPGVRCRLVDIRLPDPERRSLLSWGRGESSKNVPALDRVAKQLTLEVCASSEADSVAWRDDDRFEECLRSDPDPVGRELTWHSDGAYLVTGGLGGIGFELACALAERHALRVVLIGRRPFPEEPEWDHWLKQHGLQDRRSQQIHAIRRVRAAGGDVMIGSADVADAEAMESVVAAARDRFGPIRGVLHAAGGIEDGVIQAKAQNAIERVFASKVHGTMVLERLLVDEPLDFFLLFSSSSVWLGPPGQVDYVAANAFLNAFAEARCRRGQKTLAIGWGVWKGVGGGVELAKRLRGEPIEPESCRRSGHELLGDAILEGPDCWSWRASWSVMDLWILDEHRNSKGDAILPGTAYLELARAAYADAFGVQCVQITDVAFLEPLSFAQSDAMTLRMNLRPMGSVAEFEIVDDVGHTTFATARIAPVAQSEPPILDLQTTAAKCSVRKAQAEAGRTLPSAQQEQLNFGRRWRSLRFCGFGQGEALAELALDEDLKCDVEAFPLHPALMDIATGFALPTLKGWVAGEALFVPLAYESVRIYSPLESQIFAHVLGREGDHARSDVVTFDVRITNRCGRVLVDVAGYQMRRLDQDASFGTRGAPRSHGVTHKAPSPAEQLFLETYDAGIERDEGLFVLEKCLGNRGGAIVASPIALDAWRSRLSAVTLRQSESAGLKFARPELESSYEAPRDGVEQRLVAYWEELLGVDSVGIQDDFFELGGHSLIAVRLFAKVKKEWGVDWPISTLFEAPTIGQFAERLKAAGVAADDSASAEPKHLEDRTSGESPRFRFLVPMSKGTDGRTPLFIVAGMFGNVLNLRHLAVHLGDDRPIYALQAKGLYGEDEPHRRFEDSARDYLEEIRQVQPNGPYLLGGFSGGGVTAYEMAHQLLEVGERVAALIMLDAIPPHPAWPEPTRKDLLHIRWLRFREHGLRFPWVWLRNRIESWRRQRSRQVPLMNAERTPAEFRSELIEAAFRESLAHYVMREYPGRIHLFRPPLDARYDLGNGRVANRARQLMNPDNWWTPWAQGGVSVSVVPGDHDSMVLEPNVRWLAARVKEALDDATTQCDLPAENLVALRH